MKIDHVKITVDSKHNGEPIRKVVVVTVTEDDYKSSDFSSLLLEKFCNRVWADHGGRVPFEFGDNMKLVSIEKE